MKTSNKIIIIAILVLLSSMVLHNMKLRAAYLKGDYMNPCHDYKSMSFQGFDEIELDAATAVNLKIEQGPFKIMAMPLALDFLKIRQEGKRLIISAAFGEHYRGLNASYIMYIRCPRLSILKINAGYTVAGQKITDTVAHDVNWKPTLIASFKTDSLTIMEDYASNVILLDNQIGQLKATAALSLHAGSVLTIGHGNRIAHANLDIRNHGQLRVQATSGGETNYHLSDSARLVVNGAVAKQFLKPSQP